MEGQSYYYNNKTKNICLINKDLLGLLFKNQKIKNTSKILAKSYEDIVKSKDVPFEKINKNYYKWKVTNNDFIVITLDKSLDETLTFLKIPANNYKATIEEVNTVNKIDSDNSRKSDAGYIIKNFDFIVDDDWSYDNGTFGGWSCDKKDAIIYKTRDQVKNRCIEIVKNNYITKDDKYKLKIVYRENEAIMIVIPNKPIEKLDKYERNVFIKDYHFFDKFSDGEIIKING